jgi:hypothetical protein
MAKEWINDSRASINKNFCGVDGEGGDIPDPSALFGTVHSYQLLRAGEFKVENPDGLDFYECAKFLTGLPEKRLYVAYFFDYDVTMILKSLPKERVERIMDRTKRDIDGGWGLLPVDVGEYQVDYLPHKEFKIRRADQKHFTVINDVGTFFQSSFLTTIENWEIGTPEQREMIAKGKAMRGDFTGMTPEIRAYNAIEILLLEQLMEAFRAQCVSTGYVPAKWQGPGNLAGAMLKHHGVPRSKEIPILHNDEFRRLANDAYYGGRFETTAVGPVRRTVYQYDINSAYPAELRELPCLAHGSWKRIRKLPNYEQLWFGQVYFNHDRRSARMLCNLPMRRQDGSIYYPVEGNGVYWSTELGAAAAGGTHVALAQGWIYESHCDCRWFSFIDPYYQKRLALGKTTKGFVLKLAGNSLYGKIAQSIGYAPYANPVWAGLVTAGCRAKLVRAYTGHEHSIIMLATDGIFSLEPLDVKISRELGDWELETHDEMFIVQVGVYYLANGQLKTRGVEKKRLDGRLPDFVVMWEKYKESHGVNYCVRANVDNFVTAKAALSRRKWQLAGTWESIEREVGFDWSAKRRRVIAFEDADGIFRTLPYWGKRDEFSVGYDRMIGGQSRQPNLLTPRYKDATLLEEERMADQPDWVVGLV